MKSPKRTGKTLSLLQNFDLRDPMFCSDKQQSAYQIWRLAENNTLHEQKFKQ